MGGWGSNSYNKSKSSFSQDVWGGQAPYLQGMYGNAQDLWGNMDFAPINDQYNRVGQQMQGDMNRVYPSLDNQMGGGFRDPRLEESLYRSMENPSAMGKMYSSIMGGSGNEYIDPVIDNMYDSTFRNLQRGGIRDLDTQAANLGRAGSDRHGVESALLKSEALRDAGDREAMMRMGTYDTDLNWKMDIARQADLGRGQAQDRAMDLLSNRNQNQQGGMQYMPNLQMLAMGQMSPYQSQMYMPWDMMGMYRGTIGDPTVLSSGSSKGMGLNISGGGGVTG